MSAKMNPVDELQAFVEKHRAKDDEEATRLYRTVPVIKEIAKALAHIAQVLSVLAAQGKSLESVDEALNMIRVFAVALYLVGYRAGQESTNAD